MVEAERIFGGVKCVEIGKNLTAKVFCWADTDIENDLGDIGNN